MGRDDERGAARSLLAKIFPHVRSRHRVETRGRLVAKDPVGLVQGGADQGHLLGHATRVGGEDRVSAIRQLEALEELGDAPPAYIVRHAVEVTESVEVFDRGVAAVEPGLVRDDA